MSEEKISLQLTRDQALVLFEWIASLDRANLSSSIGDAEWSILWFLEGQFESKLVEVLAPDYVDLLAKAKSRLVKDSEEN